MEFARRIRAYAGCLILASLLLPSAAWAAAPTVIQVPGLKAAVHINVDRWGVPHIFASNEDDVFFAQGFNAARDRLFQIDLWRRRGLGRLSAAFGPNYVAQDRAARLFLYRGDMAREWAAYGPDSGAERIATQFAAGINAYIDWLEQNPSALPPEFQMLDYRPEKWTAEDVVRIRTHALTSNLSSEVSLARGLACAGRLDLNPIRRRYEPEHTTQVPEGLDPCSIPADVLDVFNRATASVNFTGVVGQPLSFSDGGDEAAEEGSNNWTIAPSRTATGRPILANDPHRAHGTPSLRYIAHLSAPGLNVIGAGEPALPGISIGHNGTIAFGLTVYAIDANDLYVYELDETLQNYRYRGGWEPFEVIEEQIEVRGGQPQTVQLMFTRHGPVIRVDAANRKAYAVRSVWLEPGTSAYFGSVDYMRARNWTEFVDALSRWGVPGENQVYADIYGNIGWKPGGLAPKRVGYDGLLPVPGDGRYEWDGFHQGFEFPEVFNPPQGFFATANQFNAQQGSRFAYEWSNPDRWRRIMEVLTPTQNHTIDDSRRLQRDIVSLRAKEIVDLVRGLTSEDPLTAEALEFITQWDGTQSLGSPHARLYQNFWESRINSAFRNAILSPADAALVGSADWIVVMEALKNPELWFGEDAAAKRDEVLLSSLRSAYQAALNQLGPDKANWGYLGTSRSMNHPLGIFDPSLNNGPFRVAGSGSTPIASGAASYAQVLDVGNWDNSIAINTPGQSGVPTSPHYRDLADMWVRGEFFPLLYSREAIEANTESKILLVPAPNGRGRSAAR